MIIFQLTKNKLLDQNAHFTLHEATKQQFISEFVSKHNKKPGFEEALKILQTDLAFAYEVLKRINNDKRSFNNSQKVSNPINSFLYKTDSWIIFFIAHF